MEPAKGMPMAGKRIFLGSIVDVGQAHETGQVQHELKPGLAEDLQSQAMEILQNEALSRESSFDAGSTSTGRPAGTCYALFLLITPTPSYTGSTSGSGRE